MTNEIIIQKRCAAKHGNDVHTSSFEDGTVTISAGSPGVSVIVHFTREQAGQLIRDLETVTSAYDATVDRYHEQCDEPVAAEVH
jgi:hypothetical protein